MAEYIRIDKLKEWITKHTTHKSHRFAKKGYKDFYELVIASEMDIMDFISANAQDIPEQIDSDPNEFLIAVAERTAAQKKELQDKIANLEAENKRLKYDIEVAIEVHEQLDKDKAELYQRISELEKENEELKNKLASKGNKLFKAILDEMEKQVDRIPTYIDLQEQNATLKSQIEIAIEIIRETDIECFAEYCTNNSCDKCDSPQGILRTKRKQFLTSLKEGE